jgi:NADPH-dependent 2,4-dienoyl-CoA reductase/sulfur reductase-like enzyme
MEAQMKAVVVGGVAGGMSFAARARRLAEDAQIVVLERDPYVSYANCGLPYYLGGEIGDRDALLLHTPQSLAESLALDVRTGHEVLAIDPAARTLLVREHATGRDYHETYDALVLSTGAAPVIPPIPGADLPPVRVLRTVPDADVLRDLVDGGARRAVVVGAGFIGLESAEALRHRGLAVTLVELAGQVLPALDPEMARSIELELLRATGDRQRRRGRQPLGRIAGRRRPGPARRRGPPGDLARRGRRARAGRPRRPAGRRAPADLGAVHLRRG